MTIRLQLSRTADGTFVVDEPTRTGSPPIGRGTTIPEAVGNYLLNNQNHVGVTFTAHESAQQAVNVWVGQQLEHR